jgi:hypothetical protein
MCQCGIFKVCHFYFLDIRDAMSNLSGMTKEPITWTLLTDIASKLGAVSETMRKWRQRGIPVAWQLKIASELSRSGYTIDPALIATIKPDGSK